MANQLMNFMRSPKNREQLKYFQTHPNKDSIPSESQSPTDHEPSTGSNVNYSAKSDHDRWKDNHDKYSQMKDKRRKRRDASNKTWRKSFWELNHMHFNIQDMSHVLMSLQSILFEPDIPIARNASADPSHVFNLNQTFDKHCYESHTFHVTQYQLRPQQYCYNCYKIITGLKHKTCTKCRLVPYCTKQCRKSNWKYHSYSCAKISRSELLHIANASSMECMDAIEDNMRHPTATLSLYLQRIHFILMHG
eukprot:550080_1